MNDYEKKLRQAAALINEVADSLRLGETWAMKERAEELVSEAVKKVTADRRTNQAGIDLIKSFEGFRAKPYFCQAGVLTIGYGHTKGVKRGSWVTKDVAERLLKEDLQVAEKAVKKYIKVPLNDNQFAALVSFTFNLGGGNLKSSTLRKRLNRGEYLAVPGEMSRWNKAGGKKSAGLVRRRKAEGKLFEA
jgi:lysozyme